MAVAVRRVLVVDDEPGVRRVVRSYLEDGGFHVDEAASGSAALEAIRREPPDLVVLDVMLPDVDGIEVLREARRWSDVGVILLTARRDEIDRVVGLEVGADDYVTKPFSGRELVARVRAVLRRRVADEAAAPDEPIEIGPLVVDPGRRSVAYGGQPVELTALEFDLLATLASSPGRVFTRRQLLERVWGADYYGDERVVDVHVANLRRALGDSADEPQVIATVRSVGYKLVEAGP